MGLKRKMKEMHLRLCFVVDSLLKHLGGAIYVPEATYHKTLMCAMHCFARDGSQGIYREMQKDSSHDLYHFEFLFHLHEIWYVGYYLD